MSKTKSTAKAQEQADELTPKQTEATAPAPAPAEATPTDAPVSPAQPKAPATPAQNEPPATEQNDPPATVAARVLCAGVIGGQRFDAGVVIDGLPSDVADAHAVMLDAHPDAVSHAVDGGAQVVVYGEA